jgi:hypothetical protein
MSVTMKGNYIFVQPGQKAFKVSSNYANYVEIGARGATPYYLEGKVDNDEFIINATLLDDRGRPVCEVKDNFPTKTGGEHQLTTDGYRIVSPSGEPLLGIQVNKGICVLQGRLYDGVGQVVAESTEDDFLVRHGPVILGRSGKSLGIVLN